MLPEISNLSCLGDLFESQTAHHCVGVLTVIAEVRICIYTKCKAQQAEPLGASCFLFAWSV